jgi:hypothetical protein
VGQTRHCKSKELHFLPWKGKGKTQLGTGFFVHHVKVSPIKTTEFVSDRKSQIVLRGRWCNIIVLNVHAPSDDSKYSFYEELEQIFDHFS